MNMSYINEIDDRREFESLTDNEKTSLKCWINNNLLPRKTFNHWHTSYGLKHKFESSKNGFYVTNGAFKVALLLCDYRVENKHDLNWNINISEKSRCFKRIKHENK